MPVLVQQRRTLPGKLCPDLPTGGNHFGFGSCFSLCSALLWLRLRLRLSIQHWPLSFPSPACGGRCPEGGWGSFGLASTLDAAKSTLTPTPLPRTGEGLKPQQKPQPQQQQQQQQQPNQSKSHSHSQRKGGDAISACMKERNGDSAATSAVHRVSSQYQFASFQSTGHWTRQRQGLPLSGRQRMPHRIP